MSPSRSWVLAPTIGPPALPEDLVPRARLLDHLDRALGPSAPEGRVVLVCGPAGAGKTTLLADWCHRASMRRPATAPAWVTLGDDDDDPSTLWTSILIAFDAIGVRPEGSTTPSADTATEAPSSHVLASLVEAVASAPTPVHLVLDDVHEVRDPGAVRGLDLLLRAAPPNLRIVLSGRFAPVGSLPRLRMEGRLVEIDGADLAFTPAETHDLLHRHVIDLGAADAEVLQRRTEGWVAGVRLAVSSLARAPDPGAFVTAFAGDDRAVADYLVAEVLAHQAPGVLDILLDTSVCEDVDVDLARVLSGQESVGAVLADLARTNSLVERRGEVYHYHALFREYLRAELQRRRPTSRPALHARAARWYADAGASLRALEHACESHEPELVHELVGRFGPHLILAGSGMRLRRALRHLGSDARRHPAVLTVSALAALVAGDVRAADELLDELRAIEGGGEPQNGADTPWSSAARVVRARSALVRGDLALARSLDAEVLRPASALALGAPRAAEGTTTGPAPTDVRLLALLNRAAIQIADGQVAHGESAAREAAHQARSRSLDLARTEALVLESVAAGSRGHARDMAARAQTVLAEGDDHGWGWPENAARAHLLLGWSGHLSMDAVVARAGATQCLALVVAEVDPVTHLAARTLSAATRADGGDAAGALVELRTAWAEPAAVAAWPVLVETAELLEHRLNRILGHHRAAELIVARASGSAGADLLRATDALHRDRPHRVDDLIAPTLTGRRACAHVPTLVEGWLVASLAALRTGSPTKAHRALCAALDLADEAGVVRPFHDVGPDVLGLLDDGVGRFGRHGSFVDQVRARAPRRRVLHVDHLTGRERELLQELPTLQTNDEIAAALSVSVNTVKTHLRSVYRKLEVTTRRDALRVARESGLL